MIKFKYTIVLFLFFLSIMDTSFSQGNPIFQTQILDNPAPGYLLVGPLNNKNFSLYDNYGRAVFTKDMSAYAYTINAFRVLDNGKLAFYRGSNGWLILDNNFNIIDSVSATAPYINNFHTLVIRSNGNYLLTAIESKVVNMKEKVQNGQTSATIENVIIQEFDQNKNLVFQWDCYQHIDVTDATEDISLADSYIDPYHINSANYDSDGNIIANFRNLDEIIKINRTTGEIMWIMGGSKSKKNQFSFSNDTREGFTGFSHQHDPKRLPNGNILLFDNGNLKPTQYSRAVEYEMNESSRSVTKVWEFEHTPSVFAEWQGNAQRLPNGNTMIGWGAGINAFTATEVTPSGTVAFDLTDGNHLPYYQILRSIVKMKAVSRYFSSARSYDFNDGPNITGININVSSLTGSGYVSVEKHDYVPYNISYSSDEACDFLPNRWVVNYNGITDLNAKLYYDLSNFFSSRKKDELRIFWRDSENFGSFKMLETTYNKQYNRLEADINSHGEFIVGYTFNPTPTLIAPSNNASALPINTTLKWTTNTTNDKYRIQLSLNNKFDTIVTERSLNAVNELECNSLLNHTTYYWRVKCDNNQCDNKWSDTYSFSTEIDIPELISPIDNSKDQPLNGVLTWEKVNGVTSCKIQISEDSTFKTTLASLIVTDTCRYIYSNFKPLTNYYWRASGSNNGVYKNWSKVNGFQTTIGKISLSLPANLIKGVALYGILKWLPLNTVIKYHIQLSRYSDFSKNIIDSIITSKTEIPYHILFNSTTYYWRVMGIVKDTVTEWSDTWQFSTIIGRPVLYYPKDKSFNNSIKDKLDWFYIDKAESYQIQLASDLNFNVIIFNLTSIDSYVEYDSLSFKTHYYWRVRAFDGTKYGDWSCTNTFYTQSELSYPRHDDYRIPVNAFLKWNLSDGVDFYELRMAQDSAFKNDNKNFTNIKGDSYLLSKLSNNKTYYWSIRSKKSGKFSQWSETFKFTTQLTNPVPLSPIDTSFHRSSNIMLNWKPSENTGFYHLQLAYDSTFRKNLIDNYKITSEQFEITNILIDTTYYWRVSSYNFKNSSDWSDVKSFIIDAVVGVDGNESENISTELGNYPNPFDNATNFAFSISNTTAVKLKIYTLDGRELATVVDSYLQQGKYQYKWESGVLNSGIYYYMLSTGNKTKTGMMTIIK